MRIFSGRIPITIQPFFLVLMVAIGWLNSLTIQGTLIWMGVIFFSVLIHEFGHAITAIYFGQKAQIELNGMGGLTIRRGPPLKLWQEFLIVLNGPLAGFLLFVGAYQIFITLGDRPINPFVYAVEVTVYANLFWTIINLLPVLPLDGGQLFRILLEGVFGYRGVKAAFFISMVLSACFGLFFLQYGALLIGMLFFMLTFEGYRNWESACAVSKQDQNSELQNQLIEAEGLLRTGEEEKALVILMQIREEAHSGMIYIKSTEYAAKILSDQQQYKKAYELLSPDKKKLRPQGLRLLQELAYRNENWEESIAIGNEFFHNHPNYETAVLNAICHSIMGQVEPAIGWLHTAVSQGLPDLGEVVKRREFDHIRDDPAFRKLESNA